MNIDQFWQIIDSVNTNSGGDMDSKCTLLRAELLNLQDDDLCDFIDHFDVVDCAAYTWPLWGAAYVMQGGCSDDAFSDFRATLISHGRKIYEQALSDPESLACLEFEDEEDICYEGFQYVKIEVAEEKLSECPKSKISFPSEPTGSEWEEDSVFNPYPQLAKKYSGEIFTQNEQISESKPWWKFW